MAQPANEFDSYDMVGIREDLSDLIFDISPTDTPMLSAIGKVKATQTLHEWQTDALAAAAANAHIEGDDSAADALTATTRLKNSTQIFKKTRLVSGTARAVDAAGREDELDYQVAKGMKEIKRDVEKAITGETGRVVGDNATARKLRGAESWIVTNESRGATGADGSDLAAPTDGTQRAFTETLLKTVAKSVYTEGGEPDILMVGPFNKQIASGFTGGATRFDNSEDKKVVAAVDVYVSDYGTYKIVPNRFSRDRTALLLQTDMWKVAVLRPITREKLAKTGDSDKVQLVWELTLECRNEKANGVVADLLTS